MAARTPMKPVDKVAALVSGTLAAGFFALAVVAAVPADEPTAPVTSASRR